MAFALTSPAFANGHLVPTQFTCDGSDAPPPLTVSDVPDGARSFALIMDDPDAPRGAFTHWLVYDIPVGGHQLHATAGKSLSNSFGRDGYGGPCPPPGHGVHHYNFTVYAVDVPSLKLSGNTRNDLEGALKQHTLAKAKLTGIYERVQAATIR